ncbi:MAG: selenocysteine-specific translation elongation factor, partial [Myxococcales bacterium]|nr:selenocysteine-specific translation elongation factor [Myxococcales bacterium]
MASFVVGTAGHVNHGKSTLVRALTGVDTDRLPEEQRRGMTIELGFAPLSLGGPGGEMRVSVIDVPGHRRFVPTMIAAATGIGLVLLVVAADEGVMPQTREHLNVCRLLGLSRAVVALTKIDRVDEETRALAAAEVTETLGGEFSAEIVPCAAPSGAGLVELRAALARRLLEDAPAGTADGPPRLWVDRVLRVRGAGTVVTGTLVAGRVRRGDRVVVASGEGTRSALVRALQVHGTSVDEACAATRLALNLALPADEIARGDRVGGDSERFAATSCLDLSVRGTSLRRGERVTLHVGTASRAARVTRVDALRDGAALARLVLDRPVPLAAGERHLVRRSLASASSGTAMGGGVVLDARPLARVKPSVRRALAGAVHDGDTRGALDVLLRAVSPRPLEPASLGLAISLAEEARRAVDRGGAVACGPGIVPRATLAQLAERARTLVTEHVARAPLDRGMPLAALRAALARVAGEHAADVAIRLARAKTGPEDGGAIAVSGDVVVPASRSGLLPRAVADAVERARGLLQAAGGHGITLAHLAETLEITESGARPLLAALAREGT